MRGQDQVSDERLEARVRLELGRWISNMGDAQVRADGGRVTISGTADPGEIASISTIALGVRGVRTLDNQLSPRGNQSQQSKQPISTSM